MVFADKSMAANWLFSEKRDFQKAANLKSTSLVSKMKNIYLGKKVCFLSNQEADPSIYNIGYSFACEF